MHTVEPACFPSCTKTSGTKTALRLIPQQRVHGVQLKQNSNMNSGATAQLTVSIACEGIFTMPMGRL